MSKPTPITNIEDILPPPPIRVGMDFASGPAKTVQFAWHPGMDSNERAVPVEEVHRATISAQESTIRKLQEQIRLKDEALVTQLRTITALHKEKADIKEWINSHI